MDLAELLEKEELYLQDPDKFCEICGDIFEDNSDNMHKKITLKCNHQFHYQCIEKHFIFNKKKECPYCRNISDFLPIPYSGYTPIPNIHYIKKKSNMCTAIIKTGKNKGSQCSFKIYKGSKCKIHSKSAGLDVSCLY